MPYNDERISIVRCIFLFARVIYRLLTISTNLQSQSVFWIYSAFNKLCWRHSFGSKQFSTIIFFKVWEGLLNDGMGGGPDRQEGGRRAPLSRHKLCRSARGQRAQMHQVRVIGTTKLKTPTFCQGKFSIVSNSFSL